MLGTDLFKNLLEKRYKEIEDRVTKNGNLEGLSGDDMNIIIIKGLDNHITHLDVDLRDEIKGLSGKVEKLSDKVDSNRKELSSKIDSNQRWMIGLMVVAILTPIALKIIGD